MKPLNVRFSEKTNEDIRFISNSGDYGIAKSLVARAAMALGLEEIQLKRNAMSHEEFVTWLDSIQAK